MNEDDRIMKKKKWNEWKDKVGYKDSPKGFDFTFTINDKYYYAEGIFKGSEMACNVPSANSVYIISKEDYEDNTPLLYCKKKEYVKEKGINIREWYEEFK